MNILKQLKIRISKLLYGRLIGDEFSEDIKKYLLHGSFASFSISIGSSILAMFIGFLMAKLLGPGGFGTYTYIFSWVMLLSVFASFGIDDLSVREIAKFQSKNDSGVIKGFLIWSILIVLGLSIAVPLLSLTTFNVATLPGIKGQEHLFKIALIAIPFIALLHLSQGHLKGLSKVIPSKLPEKIIRPIFLIIFIMVIILMGDSLTIKDAVLANTFAFLIALITSIFYLGKHAREFFSSTIKPAVFQHPIWVKSAPFFFLLSAIEIINSRADILMLGLLTNSSNVGIYSIAARLADMIPFVLMILSPVLAPLISKLYFTNNTRNLQVLYRKSARITFFMALPVFIVFAIWGTWILSLFGPGFSSGYFVLIILGVAQLFNAFTGTAGNMLLMTGFEKEILISYGAGVIINILLNLWLIPLYGIYGAAIGTGFTLFLCNFVMCIYVFKKIGVSPVGSINVSK